jgi:2-dehydropantoate 2-reductase
MRFIVYGAGAIGGVIGARLAQAGEEVVLIARGAHADAMRSSGLVVQDPDGEATVDVPVATEPDGVRFSPGDVVLLAMKSQDTPEALHALRRAAPADTPVFCAQNGVENERAALRIFADVYGVCVMCPTGHLEPGVVQAHAAPVTGILDLGRYARGLDDTAEAVAAALSGATFLSEARPDVMRWKYTKLLMNLGNAIEAVCGPEARRSALAALVREEGIACLRAAGIAFASDEEDGARRAGHLTMRPVAGQRRGGGSSWQSLARGAGSIESDYLNGEIVLIGREHDVPTPANALLQRLANDLALSHAPPGSVPVDDVLERLALR